MTVGDTLYVVQQGDWTSSIARRFGFADFMEIYNYDRNRRLRELRPDPNELLPGDEVWIPEGRAEVRVRTWTYEERVWRISVDTGPREELKLVLRDASRQPLRNTEYVLRLGAFEHTGRTDGGGQLRESLYVDLLPMADLVLIVAGQRLPIKVGYLDPAGTLSGAQGRLKNLGYYDGALDGQINPETRRALHQFQLDVGQNADGLPHEATLRRLDEKYKETA